MGYYVHLSVIFACDTNEGIAKLAESHLKQLKNRPKDKREYEAEWFLEDLSTRTGSNPGPKGGLSLWGIIGNYTVASDFVESLNPFWKDLLSGVEGGPCKHEHVVVFSEPEQNERAEAHEIYLDEATEGLIVKHHLLPFAWMQF